MTRRAPSASSRHLPGDDSFQGRDCRLGMFDESRGDADAARSRRVLRPVAYVDVLPRERVHERQYRISYAYEDEVRCALPVLEPEARTRGIEQFAGSGDF